MSRSFFQGFMKHTLFIATILVLLGETKGQGPYIGTSLGFADYLEERCDIVFREEGYPADPFMSMARHGASILRIHVGHPPFSNSYSEGERVDHHSVDMAGRSLRRVKNAGLKSMLTFTYQSFALEDEDQQNIYVAPLAWQPVASDTEKMVDSVYTFTYAVLDHYCEEGLIPEIVSVGQESTWHRLMPNVPEDELPPYDPARSVAIHNAGARAVRDIAMKYDTAIKVCFHMRGPSVTKWWLEEHWPYGPDLDMIGISLYHGWNFDDYAGFESLGEYVQAITGTYDIEFIVMETAQMFRTGGNDAHVDILGTDLIPPGYPNPPTTETQKQYLADLTGEVLESGGSGVLAWGGDWVASDCYIYADRWGKGSSWENKAFWDFNNNLHDGVNWMMAFSGKVPVTFKVDLTGVDTTNGVYVTGDFENFRGDSWLPNRMVKEGNRIYLYTVYLEPGTSGLFYFQNDSIQAARESIHRGCTGDTLEIRSFTVPEDSGGEIFAFAWGSCDSIPQLNLTTLVTGEGYTSPVSGIYSHGTEVTITATPVLGQRFTGWTGDTVTSVNPLKVSMTRNRHMEAHFESIPTVLVRFEVDMAGTDVSNGVFVTGDFPNMEGKTWQLNRMGYEGGTIWSYTTRISAGASGAFYFMNDDRWGERETVPAACAVYYGADRGYQIPESSTGETFAFIWSSCDQITTVSPLSESGPGNASLVKLYPNPLNRGPLSMEFYVADRVVIEVIDPTGRTLFRDELNALPGRIHTADLLPDAGGVYLVRCYFIHHNILDHQKIIFQHPSPR